jgi:hypothetical protein
MFRYDGSYDGPNFANLRYPATIELFRAFLLPYIDHFTRPALNYLPLVFLLWFPLSRVLSFSWCAPLL